MIKQLFSSLWYGPHLFYVLPFALLLSAMLYRVRVRAQLIRVGYDLSLLQTEQQTLLSQRQNLKTELEARKSPLKSLKPAEIQFSLGMVQPHQWVFVKRTQPVPAAGRAP